MSSITKKEGAVFLTDAQLREEVAKCEYCAEKPCKEACPADCSPADFIMAVKVGEKQDFERAAALIMGHNPLGGICGAVCPDKHCMSACVHKTFDKAVNIPAVQATIIQKAKELGVLPKFNKAKPNGKKIAVMGAGPAGLGAAAVLGQVGYKVTVFEDRKAGGGATLIPPCRLEPKVLSSDMKFLLSLGDITVKSEKAPAIDKMAKVYDGVVVATGQDLPYKLNIPGEDAAIPWTDYLANPKKYKLSGKNIAVVGGGAVAADCAEAAVTAGAARVELFALEKFSELPLTQNELDGLQACGAELTGRTKISEIMLKGGKVCCLKTMKVELPAGKKFSPRDMKDVAGSEQVRSGFDAVIVAIGARSSIAQEKIKNVIYAGDMANGPTSVVEAVASGKNAGAKLHALLGGGKPPKEEKKVKSRVVLAGRDLTPVSLETDFFGRKLISPFILSAAPPSDGYEQMKKAYEAGWAGGVMKTAFDGVSIHIPSQYMFAFTQDTYANCDNVSGHPLNRVCKEIGKLIREYPDRLTMASTGGPVTGDDEADKKGWQSNTKMLEKAGVMGIEYSLSCPQGGDGTKGDIVSQDPELTAKIIGWVMEVGDPNVPKLFKLTAAVTSIYPVVAAIKEVFAKYPNKKAGITLANTFPTLAFRKGAKKEWEEGIVVGMSGEGVIPISNLTLANVARHGVHVSGNGGPMDYKSAANFLALGVHTVQFCTIAMKYGYGVISDLESGLSFLMKERGIKSVAQLKGRALPNPVTGFMELTPVKKISAVKAELCQHCGNCTRCPYLAIKLDGDLVPQTDPERCIGCSICTQKCFSGALYMRERTKQELSVLKED